MGTVPAFIFLLTQQSGRPHWFWVMIGCVLATIGLLIICHTFFLITDQGGTPAPFDPPRKFVERGLYCFVRNPMMIGVTLVLLGESAGLRSFPLLGWALFFAVTNLVYIPWFEEPELKRRFGKIYEDYWRRTPRWIPKTGYRTRNANGKTVNKDRFSIFDWVGFAIGVIVTAFILLILIWPFIDPTPNRSTSLKNNLNSLVKSSP
tara:strand:- start:181 stop:795 length:615 start_codon:yes stop_codon:yes gene_type:complete